MQDLLDAGANMSSERVSIREILQTAIPTFPKLKTKQEEQGHIWMHYSVDDRDGLVAVFNDNQEVREFSI